MSELVRGMFGIARSRMKVEEGFQMLLELKCRVNLSNTEPRRSSISLLRHIDGF